MLEEDPISTSENNKNTYKDSGNESIEKISHKIEIDQDFATTDITTNTLLVPKKLEPGANTDISLNGDNNMELLDKNELENIAFPSSDIESVPTNNAANSAKAQQSEMKGKETDSYKEFQDHAVDGSVGLSTNTSMLL